jgi:hypothetical protein
MPHMPAGPAPQAQEFSKLFASSGDADEVWAANVENLRSTDGLPQAEHEAGVPFLPRTSSSNVVSHWEQ